MNYILIERKLPRHGRSQKAFQEPLDCLVLNIAFIVSLDSVKLKERNILRISTDFMKWQFFHTLLQGKHENFTETREHSTYTL